MTKFEPSPTSRAIVVRYVCSFVLLVAGFVATSAAASAADPPRPHISPALDGVAVQGAAYEAAQRRYDQILTQITADKAQNATAIARLAELVRETARLGQLIATDTEVKAAADAILGRIALQLRHLALQAYVTGASGSGVTAQLDLDETTILKQQSMTDIQGAVRRSSLTTQREQFDISAAAATRLAQNRRALGQAMADTAATTRTRDRSAAAIVTDTATSVTRHGELLLARATAYVTGTNLPLVALDAYFGGAAAANAKRPGCHISWPLLAGIGQIESHQGTYGGSSLDAVGNVTIPIFGIPLDGTGGNEQILTADGSYSRAEGPMQFLPGTWAAVAVDGDGNGTSDPQNLYDAAATAASYLCRGGQSLDTPDGQTAAILTYNNSGAYVASVTAAAQGYSAALPAIPPPPAPPASP